MMDALKIHTTVIESTKVGAIPNQSSWKGTNAPLLYLLRDLPLMWEEQLKSIREMEYHTKEQLEAKGKVPRFYVSGAYDFSRTDRFAIYDKPVVKANLMTIDVDEKDNPDIDIWAIREKIFNLDYVYCCLKSVSGHGFYAIIPIEDTDYTKEHYNYVRKLWKQQYGIECDPKANTLVRARIISLDDEAERWIKKDTYVKVFTLKLREKPSKTAKDPEKHYSKYEHDGTLDKYIPVIMEKLIDEGYKIESYGAWYHIGCELKNFENGEQMFLKLSRNNPKYDDSINVIKKKYAECEASGIDDNLRRKWMGMAKNKWGKDWMNVIKQSTK